MYRGIFVNTKQQLQKKIKHTELQIKALSLNSSDSSICEDLYNSLILQKAVLKKQLKDMDKNPLVEGIKKILPRREKLICDYFK